MTLNQQILNQSLLSSCKLQLHISTYNAITLIALIAYALCSVHYHLLSAW